MFKITLYNNKSNNDVIDKILVNGNDYNCTARGEIDIVNPEIIIGDTVNNILTFNYAHIAIFGKYYYINNIRIKSDKLCILSLSVDVLKSYKDVILNSTFKVNRKHNSQNIYSASIVKFSEMIPYNENFEHFNFDIVRWAVPNNLVITQEEFDDLERLISAGVHYVDRDSVE